MIPIAADSFWRPMAMAISKLAAAGDAPDPSRAEARPAMPEAEWRDAWHTGWMFAFIFFVLPLGGPCAAMLAAYWPNT